MYQLVKFGGHRSYRNGDTNPDINFYILEKCELTTGIRHIARFLRSGIPIYNFPDTAGRKTRKEKDKRLQSVLRFMQTPKQKIILIQNNDINPLRANPTKLRNTGFKYYCGNKYITKTIKINHNKFRTYCKIISKLSK